MNNRLLDYGSDDEYEQLIHSYTMMIKRQQTIRRILLGATISSLAVVGPRNLNLRVATTECIIKGLCRGSRVLKAIKALKPHWTGSSSCC